MFARERDETASFLARDRVGELSAGARDEDTR
jgi:hypothetical protein